MPTPKPAEVRVFRIWRIPRPSLEFRQMAPRLPAAMRSIIAIYASKPGAVTQIIEQAARGKK